MGNMFTKEKIKKIFKRENLLILLVVGLIGHNVYLQFQVENAVDAAEVTKYGVNRAANNAKEAASYASDAADYANEAADYASDAADNAENAYYSAEDAADNAYGNECWDCP